MALLLTWTTQDMSPMYVECNNVTLGINTDYLVFDFAEAGDKLLVNISVCPMTDLRALSPRHEKIV